MDHKITAIQYSVWSSYDQLLLLYFTANSPHAPIGLKSCWEETGTIWLRTGYSNVVVKGRLLRIHSKLCLASIYIFITASISQK